jgi:hypothetical protein
MTNERDMADGGTDRQSSTATLIRTASAQLSRLVRAELALARAELASKAQRAAIGLGLLVGAGAVAAYGVGAALVTLGLLLMLLLPAWLAALIVTVVALATAGLLAALGRGRLRRVGSVIPQLTVDSVKTDVRTVRAAVTERGKR